MSNPFQTAMSHMTFISNQRQTKTENRVIISKILDTEASKHDKPHAFACCVMGRSPDCDIRITDQACSRHHCIVFFRDGRVYIKDLDSRCGTLVNGTMLTPLTDNPLVSNDIIQINGERFIVIDVKIVEDVAPVAPLSAATVATVQCPYCQAQAPVFNTQIEGLIQQVDFLREAISNQRRELETSRTFADVVRLELEKMQRYHSSHFQAALQQAQSEKQAEMVKSLAMDKLTSEYVASAEAAQELRASQLSGSLAPQTEVKIDEKPQQMQKSGFFSRFSGIFGKKSTKDHKPTPFAKMPELEDEEQNEQEHQQEVDIPEVQPEEPILDQEEVVPQTDAIPDYEFVTKPDEQ